MAMGGEVERSLMFDNVPEATVNIDDLNPGDILW